MRKMMLSILLLTVGVAKGAIIEFPLNCEGEYIYGDTWTADVDFGVEFAEISNVYIDWSGEITASQDMFVLVAYQFVASLYEFDPHDYFSQASVRGGVATYPDPEPFSLPSTFTDEDWTLLLDGQSSIQIWFGDTPHAGSGGAGGSGTLNQSKLIVEGVVVPEPTTVLLLSCGLFWIRKKHTRPN